MPVRRATEPGQVEQHRFGARLYRVLLYEAEERVQSDASDQQSVGKVPYTVPKTEAGANKENNEIIKLKTKQLAILK